MGRIPVRAVHTRLSKDRITCGSSWWKRNLTTDDTDNEESGHRAIGGSDHRKNDRWGPCVERSLKAKIGRYPPLPGHYARLFTPIKLFLAPLVCFACAIGYL